MAQAKQTTQGKICLIGNIQVGDLYRSTPEQIDLLCRETIEQGKDDGGFILCVSSSYYSSHMDERVLANYMAYIDAGLKYGKY